MSDSYEDQLRILFEASDEEGRGHLGRASLAKLCRKLELEEPQSLILINQLLSTDDDDETSEYKSHVTFDEFKLGLVRFLENSQQQQQQSASDAVDRCFARAESPPREVEPKFVSGRKKYGRRSRPGSVADETSPRHEPSPSNDQVVPVGLSPPDVSAGLLPSSGFESERECLKEMLRGLGVGEDDFLDRAELQRVCQAVGMERVPEEVVDQLFAKLDLDNDGRVAFEDLLGLFQASSSTNTNNDEVQTDRDVDEVLAGREQMGSSFDTRRGSSASSSSVASVSHHNPHFARHHPVHRSPRSADSLRIDQHSYFSQIDAENNGFATMERVSEFFETVLGFPVGQGCQILRSVGMAPSTHSGVTLDLPVDLRHLTAVLEDELDQVLSPQQQQVLSGAVPGHSPSGSSRSVSSGPNSGSFNDSGVAKGFEEEDRFMTAKAGAYACRNEIRHLRSVALPNLTLERDKLRSDLSESNQRTLQLAQEIDEQNAKTERMASEKLREMESRYVDQIRHLESTLSKEKDQFHSLRADLEVRDKDLQGQWAEQEAKMKEECEMLKMENQRLEKECANLLQQLSDLRDQGMLQQKQLEQLSGLQEQLMLSPLSAAVMTGAGAEGKTHLEVITQQVEDLTTLNKDLKDQNDELSMQLEAAKSLLQDRPEQKRLKAKRRGSTPTSLTNIQRQKPSRSISYTAKLMEEEEEESGEIDDASRRCQKRRNTLLSEILSESCDLEEDEEVEVEEVDEESGSPREGKIRRTQVDLQEENLESIGAELGVELSHPPIESCPSSLSSVEDDGLVEMGNAQAQHQLNDPEATTHAVVTSHPAVTVANPKEATTALEERCRQLEQELQRLRVSHLGEAAEVEKRLKEEAAERLEQIEEEHHKILLEKDRELAAIRESTSAEISRLRSARAEADENGRRLEAKCDKMEQRYERLRESVVSLGMPASTALSRAASISGPPSASSATSITSGDNVQVISIKTDGNKRSSNMVSNVSKVTVNSTEVSSTRNARLSSASFSGAAHAFHKPQVVVKNSSNVGLVVSQPASLPAFAASGAVKRSRSTSGSSSSSGDPSHPQQGGDSRLAKVQVFQLEQHCRNLEGELEDVKEEIMKILSDKSSASRENESLRQYASAYNELRRENEQLKLKLSSKDPPKSPALSTSSKSSSTSSSDPTGNADRSSPDGQEFEDETTSSSASGHACRRASKDDDSLKLPSDASVADKSSLILEETFKKRLESAESERKTLMERCSSLEESLELMRAEFENMEDYWQGKLDEERSFYENQLRSSEDNLRSLEARVREYEELFELSGKDLSSGSNSSNSNGGSNDNSAAEKLSTIAETASLEGQVADLEDEIADLRSQLQSAQEQKYDACRGLEAEWRQKEAGLAARAATAEERARSAEDRLGEAREELEKANKEREQLSQQLIQLRQQHFQLQLSSTTPDASNNNNGSSSNTQPSSLPPDLTAPGVDLHKLRQLRRAVREECEQLLQRREHLQQDVVILARQLSSQQQQERHNPVKRHHSTHVAKRGSLDLKRTPSASVSTSPTAQPLPNSSSSSSSSAPATSTAMSPAHAFSSLARAYKAVLIQIQREKVLLERELAVFLPSGDGAQGSKSVSTISSGVTISPVKLLQVKLRQQEDRCASLQDALRDQKQHSLQILQAARERHRAEIDNFEQLMRASQASLRRQVSRYAEQVRRLARSDAAVRRLAAENETLLVAIQTLEDSIRGDSSSVGSGDTASTDNSSSSSEKCLEFIHEALCASLTDEVAALRCGGFEDVDGELCVESPPGSPF